MILMNSFILCLVIGWFPRLTPAWVGAPLPDASVNERPLSQEHKLLVRRYRQGQTLSYHMQGTNRDRLRTTHYSAQADGVVKTGQDGIFFEEYKWSGLTANGSDLALNPESKDFREMLSLDLRYKASIPKLSQIQPILIGPVLDLLTFYVDLQLAMRQDRLNHAGYHARFERSMPNRWADGKHVLIGEDAIDFDITLVRVDRPNRTATVLVRHIPPAQRKVNLPVDWMRAPVASAENNWVQVIRNDRGSYTASVGKETFEDEIEVSLIDGRIMRATMNNPVEVLERECVDSALRSCGAPVRYEIRRQIKLY
jgi:hypothetical protein